MLFRAERGYITTGDYVQFYMDDSRTKDRVACRVSREALDDRAARDKLRHSELPLERFKSFRTEIEAIVRDKHERGLVEPEGYVLVSTADLSP